MPARILDLFTEFRDHTNGLGTVAGNGLLGALAHHGLDCMGAAEKKEMRDLVMRGAPWFSEERSAILDYCEEDVDALARLLPAMLPRLDLPHALMRGRYMAAAAAMEHVGTPIDVDMLNRLQQSWTVIQNLPDTFREAARAYPIIAPLRELRHALSSMRLTDLAIGKDGRNRTMLSAFRARSGRNQPSNTKFIFGPSVWLRGLVKPPPGYGVAYIDWSQQEFGIAAVLSGDTAMQEAYLSGDRYLKFGQQAGAIPPKGTKETHKALRDLYKTCVLGVQYGMGRDTLAWRIAHPPHRRK